MAARHVAEDLVKNHQDKLNPLNFRHLISTSAGTIFDNLPEKISPKQASLATGYSVATIYDWAYRPTKYGTPDDLFVKKRNPREKTRIRRDILKYWKDSLE